MQTLRTKPELDGGDRHPFGRELPDRWMHFLWSAVLFIAIVVPGVGYQTALSTAAISWSKYFNSLLLMVAFSALVLLVTYLLSGRNRGVALRLGASVVLVTFLWPTFGRFDFLPFVGALVVVGAPALIVLVAGSYGDRLTSTLIILGLAVVVLGTSLGGVVSRRVAEPQVESFASVGGGNVDVYPDALFILLDGYGRGDVLEDFYDYDNSRFLRDIVDLGFEVNEGASSNYNRTYASVASMMDLGYPIKTAADISDSPETIRGLLGQGGSLVAAFRDAGYELTFSENAWGSSRCGSPVDHCWRTEVTRTNAYYLSLLTPIAPLVRQNLVHPVNSTSWAQINQLASVVLDRTERQAPQLIWAHFVLPHPPVNLDGSCVEQTDSWRNGLMLTGGGADDDRRREAFVEQTKCTNETLTRQLKPILEKNPEMVVFLFSDHGPDGQQQLTTFPSDLTVEQIQERYGILLATRMGDQCGSIGSVATLVNGTRLFVGCALGLNIEAVDERSFIVSYFGNDVPVLEMDPVGLRP